ncbi:MAG TPA: hypothetical protein VGV14_14380 [Rhodanobacter sp.]|nr:hypothetical protein [Rhodanobacter sp.]
MIDMCMAPKEHLSPADHTPANRARSTGMRRAKHAHDFESGRAPFVAFCRDFAALETRMASTSAQVSKSA